MKLTRRGLLSSIPAVALTAQDQPAAADAKPTREQDLANARDLIRNNSAALAKVKIPVEVEPAFQFKA
jgi:hypothetical protein